MNSLIEFKENYSLERPLLPATAEQLYEFASVTEESVGQFSDGLRYNTQFLQAPVAKEIYSAANQLIAEPGKARFEIEQSPEQKELIADCLDLDFPDTFMPCNAIFNLVNGKISSLQFNIDDSQFFEQRQLAQQLVLQQVDQLKRLSTYERARGAYEFICSRFKFTTEINYLTSSALCIINAEANSYGVAKLFELLCNHLGVTCITKKATQNQFVEYFNIIHVNSKYANVDCAMALEMKNGEISFGYFGFPDIYLKNLEVVGQKPPCKTFELSDFYVNGGLFTQPQNELEHIYEYVANCYLKEKNSCDFLIVSDAPVNDFKQFESSVCYGVYRYLQSADIDARQLSVNFFKEVPICRVNFVKSPIRRGSCPVMLKTWSKDSKKQLSEELGKLLKKGFRTIYLVVDQFADFKRISEDVIEDMFSVLQGSGVEDLRTFNYSQNDEARVIELQM